MISIMKYDRLFKILRVGQSTQGSRTWREKATADAVTIQFPSENN